MSNVGVPTGPKVSSPKKASTLALRLKRTRRLVKPKPQSAAVNPDASYVSAFAIGDHITHAQFGEGTVTEIDDAKLTIKFASRGTKQIIDRYVQRPKGPRPLSEWGIKH